MKEDLETGHQPLIDPYPYEIRKGFVTKVYTILGLQLLVSSILCGFTVYNLQLQAVARNENVMAFAMVSTFASVCAINCFSQKYPWNLLLLAVFTIGESLLLSRLCLLYSLTGHLNIVFVAIAITSGIFILLTSIVVFTKRDFSFMENMLTVGIFSLFGFTIVGAFFPSTLLTLVISWFGVLLFSGYILYDTSLVLYRLGPDDAIHASLVLYLDIVNVFVFVLNILRGSGD